MRAIHRNRVIEVCACGRGNSRIWHAFVDGRPLTFVRHSIDAVTRSYGSENAGAQAAREQIDAEFFSFSSQTQTDPHSAVQWCSDGLQRVTRRLVEAKKRLHDTPYPHTDVAQSKIED